jgi:hypothetical protein
MVGHGLSLNLSDLILETLVGAVKVFAAREGDATTKAHRQECLCYLAGFPDVDGAVARL